MGSALVGREQEQERLIRSLRHGVGAVVTGALGVGKTRLAEAVLDEFEAEGLPVVRIAATRSTATIPFGAVADLLPPDPSAGAPNQLLRGIATGLSRRGEGRQVIVGVDDAHLLDPGSAAAVHHALSKGIARVLVTVRAGEPCPDAVISLWKDGGADRLELADLASYDAHRLAIELLGAPPSGELWGRLWQAGRGNPFYQSELIRGGSETGTIRIVDRKAELRGSLGPSGRLLDVLVSRLEHYSEDARAVLDMLAIAEPLSHDVLEITLGDPPVAELERTELVRVSRSGSRTEVRTAHPAISETLRALTPASVRRDLARSLVAALEDRPADRDDDRIRRCIVRLEAGLFDDPTRFLEAAAAALDRFDGELAERLLRPVLDRADPVEAALLMGRSLRMRHCAAEAEQHLERASAEARDDPQRARAALELAQLRLYQQHRPAEAMQVLRQARDLIHDVAWRHELDALSALFSTFTGDLRTAAQLGERVLEDPTPTSPVLNTVAISTIAQVLLGRFREAERALAVALPLATEAPPDAHVAAELLRINDFSLDLLAGRVEESVRKARAGFERVRADAWMDVVGVWGSTLLLSLLPSGRIAEAEAVAAEAVAALELSDPLGLLASTVAGQATVAAQAGKAADARRFLEHPVLRTVTQEGRATYHRARALVWASAVEGRLAQATRHALEGGLRAVDNDLVVWGAILLHDAVRLRRPEGVVTHLREIADRVEGSFAPALADHAEALAGGDGDAVLGVAGRFSDMGATLLAAEGAAQASRLLRAEADERAANRAASQSRALARRCTGARTPALTLAPQPLTPRERQVALMATAGMNNREIATELVISKRTVENHLASVYRTLGVSDREEAARVLGGADPVRAD